jgi:hypothetical protein
MYSFKHSVFALGALLLIDPPVYGVNNHALVTGGTGSYENASGFI